MKNLKFQLDDSLLIHHVHKIHFLLKIQKYIS